MDFMIVEYHTGIIVETFRYKGGRHRARINRKVARMNEEFPDSLYYIENI